MTQPRNDATLRQIEAADPGNSTWLAANAGSGKTRVLTDRVARLLLDGTQPQRILCLTYTKAAASEMQNRLFRRLGEWAMLDDAALTQALWDLGAERSLSADRLREARTLFARAIETPGGLKIQTIHAFCASLLRRFPLEAGVSPNFSEMEERSASLLRAEIVDALADGPDQAHVADVARYGGGDDFDGLTSALVRLQTAFETPLSEAEIKAAFGLGPDLRAEDIIAGVFAPGTLGVLADLIPFLKAGSKTDQKAAETLQSVTGTELPLLESVLLTGAGAKVPFSAKIGSFPTKSTQKSCADLMPALEALMTRVEDARSQRLSLEAASKSAALHRFAARFLPEYARRKQLRGWLDFDDLILKAESLLNDPAVAAWVLYRLDGGIDHILVDEAQDTSPAQWNVIEKLAQEFTSGLGARADTPRTIFVVGDKKQSIYSFQGADPDAFDRMQADFAARLDGSGTRLHDLTLEYSFRSSQAILHLVDLVFEGQEGAGFPRGALHRAFKSELPGRVDLWPVVEPVDDPDERDWHDPVDRRSPQHHTVILATRIAAEIKRMIASGQTLPDASGTRRRPVRAGDFLILVQRRSDLFAEIIRACKAERLPIAGADRLKVGAELAVKDLGALLSFLSTPEDSLALATVLRSPLFGWSEQQLFDLAHRREGRFLWQSLRERNEEFPGTLSVLNDLRGQTDFLRPYDLIERILTRHDGRRLLLGRLGAEAEDGINALLSQALAYERTEVPSLTGFLSWMQTDDLEIKRQIDNASDMIRVMTVHGSKGLEAPIVILPDTGKRRPPPDDEIMVAGGLPLWRMTRDSAPPVLSEARDTAQNKILKERQRLLYVALTRAETWLIVAAAGELDKKGTDTWYQQVEAGLHKAGAVATDLPGGQGVRLTHGDWDTAPLIAEQTATPPPVDLPPYLRLPAPDPAPVPQTRSPSDLGGAKALPGEGGRDTEAALKRGSLVHRLLEQLPPNAPDLWESDAKALTGAEFRADILAEARDVLMSKATSFLFSDDALSEVPVSAQIGQMRIHGSIDRLVVRGDTVWAIDFKTNGVVPQTPAQCPDGILRQMGAYGAALMQIFPEKQIRLAVVWTAHATLMELPHELVTSALQRVTDLDASTQAS